MPRKFCLAQPKLREGFDGCEKLVEIGRFSEEAVSLETVNFVDVIGRVGVGNDDDGDVGKQGVGLDLLEHLPTVFAGEIQIQKDQVWSGHFGKAAFFAKELRGHFAVGYDLEIIGESGFLQRFLRQPGLSWIVFNQ